MVPNGNKAKRPLFVNHIAKKIQMVKLTIIIRGGSRDFEKGGGGLYVSSMFYLIGYFIRHLKMAINHFFFNRSFCSQDFFYFASSFTEQFLFFDDRMTQGISKEENGNKK